MAISQPSIGQVLTLAVLIAAPAGLRAQLQEPLFELATYAVPGPFSISDLDIGDVNGDGIADLGVLRSDESYRILFGRGDGTFFPALVSPLGIGVSQIWRSTLADVTGDGRADRLLVGTHDNIHVQQSLGDGQFTTLGVYPIGCAPWEVHAVELNGDGLPDLLASFGDHLVCTVGFTSWLGDGQGGFHDKYTQLPPVSVDMAALSPADLDGDGDLDLVATSTGGSLCRFIGMGNGHFGPMIAFPTPGSTADTSDFDEDGWMDVVSLFTGNLLVYRGTGKGLFAPAIVSPEAPASQAWLEWERHLTLGDFNCDGHTDAAGSLDGQCMISLGTGSGAFEPASPQIPGITIHRPRAADLDDNGSVDLVAAGSDASGQLVVLLNTRPAWPWSTVGPGLPAAGLAAPKLSAVGTLEAGEVLTLTLQDGASGAPAVLVVGPDRINAPFKGGVLVPFPTVLLALALDPAGGFQLEGSIPAGLPSGSVLYLQAWIVDAQGPAGFTSSNAVQGKVP